MKKSKNKNLDNFIIYIASIISITLFLISFLTIKNYCTKINNYILILDKSVTKNASIVKTLQSQKDYFLSEQYISQTVNNMIVVAPEPEIIDINNE